MLRPESLEGTDEEDPVSALEWDPLSSDYLLGLWVKGHFRETGAEPPNTGPSDFDGFSLKNIRTLNESFCLIISKTTVKYLKV